MKHVKLVALLSGIGSIVALDAMALPSVTLTGTIRDFCAPAIAGTCTQNPDFEGAIGGLQTGQVAGTLGLDGKPVFVGPAKPGFTTAANFNQWYNDVPGVNQAAPFSVTLDETAPGSGIFSFQDNSFFPIDGLLFGNQGRSHNYHFTLELHGQFSFKAGDSFSFTGDDDLWVFVDDKLFLDLGGVHPAANGSFTSGDLIAAGLLEDTVYDISIFFAERHTTQSNFQITTSFSFVPAPVPATLALFGIGLIGLATVQGPRRGAVVSRRG